MFTSEKEIPMTHIWVTQEYADKYNELDKCDAQAKIALEIIDSKKLDVTNELSQLDDDLIRFKAACLVHKSELEKVYNEQQLRMEKLIDDCWDVMPLAKKNAQKMADELQPFADKVTDLSVSINKVKELTQGIDFYGIDKITKLVEQVSYMDSASKEIFSFLMTNYKKESND